MVKARRVCDIQRTAAFVAARLGPLGRRDQVVASQLHRVSHPLTGHAGRSDGQESTICITSKTPYVQLKTFAEDKDSQKCSAVTDLPSSPRERPLFGPLPARMDLKLATFSTIVVFICSHRKLPLRTGPRCGCHRLILMRWVERSKLATITVQPENVAKSDPMWLSLALLVVTV